MVFFAVLALFLLQSGDVQAQDPAEGWMAYAVGSIPSTYERITRLEMTWKVGAQPRRSFSFFSPWFGMDPADNLNLIQPVNPWSGSAWSYYTEYYQWKPTHNSNSKQISIKAGYTLKGSLVYNAAKDAYLLTQTCVETGQSSSQTVVCQNGKKYNIPYVVYEKTFPCRNYPPDEVVTFTNIVAECDGVDCTSSINWQAKVKDPNCDMTAHIDSPKQIRITWSTTAESRYDNMTQAELFELNANRGSRGWERPLLDRHRST